MTYPVSLFGSFIAGATVININPLFKTRELLDVLVNSEAEIIIVLDKFYGELEPIIKKTKIKNVILCSLTDLLSPLMKFIVKSVLFFKGENPEISYADRKGKYQGQTGITLAKSK